jgi:hypothetical protein
LAIAQILQIQYGCEAYPFPKPSILSLTIPAMGRQVRGRDDTAPCPGRSRPGSCQRRHHRPKDGMLHVNDLTYRIGDRLILDHASFNLPTGS